MTPAVVGLLALAAVLWPVRGAAQGWVTGPRTGGTPVPSPRRPTIPETADAAVLLSLAIGSGRAVADALDQVAALSPDPVRRDLARVSAATRWGRALPEAWGYADPVWRTVALALAVALECGAPAAEVLREAAASMREEQARHLEAASARAGVLLVLPLGMCFLPAFVCTAVVPLVVVLLDRTLAG